ncbi:hypothetical protein EVAR_19630_1 [Eumeta japonica]|uniref:Uncharacterized protein n=1 Tax=Eumeta variegata TaxID=151549 RepID=A0A4C1UFG6_EUMVA|nr:hypothetical protein EVAR_19630_1 [Eumeta japonica]
MRELEAGVRAAAARRRGAGAGAAGRAGSAGRQCAVPSLSVSVLRFLSEPAAARGRVRAFAALAVRTPPRRPRSAPSSTTAGVFSGADAAVTSRLGVAAYRRIDYWISGDVYVCDAWKRQSQWRRAARLRGPRVMGRGARPARRRPRPRHRRGTLSAVRTAAPPGVLDVIIELDAIRRLYSYFIRSHAGPAGRGRGRRVNVASETRRRSPDSQPGQLRRLTPGRPVYERHATRLFQRLSAL